MTRLILFLILLVFLVTGLMVNAQNDVIIYYYLNLSWQIKIYLLVLASFSTGIIIAGILLLPEWISMKLSLSAKKKEISALCNELAEFRKNLMRIKEQKN